MVVLVLTREDLENKRMEYHWCVSVSLAINSNYSACIKCLIRDVFDVGFAKELKVLYSVYTWSEVLEELKKMMVDYLKQNIIG